MAEKMSKQMKSLLYKGGSLVLLGIFMFTAVFGYLSRSFGWFSDNTEVSASGMSVQSSEGLNVKVNVAKPNPDSDEGGYVFPELNDTSFSAFFDLTPGDLMTVYVKVENYESSPVTLNLSLAPPTAAQEVPIIHRVTTDSQGNEVVEVVDAKANDGATYRYHYFGSQLRINSMALVDGEGTLASGSTLSYLPTGYDCYLLQTSPISSSGGTYQTTFVSAEKDFSGISSVLLTNDFTLPAATVDGSGTVTPSSVVIAVEVEFVDNHELQNAYINFGEAITLENGVTITPICQRKLICTTVTN